MSKKAVFLINKLEELNLETDNTILIMKKAVNLDIETYALYVDDIYSSDGLIFGNIRKYQDEILSEPALVDLSKVDYVFIRHNPPYDINYLTPIYLLEKIKNKVSIINNPTEIINCPEKVFTLNFPEFCPPTAICNNLTIAEKFFNKYKKIILKPLYQFGGKDINLVDSKESLAWNYNYLSNKYGNFIVVQKFLEEIEEGDKRVIFLDGEIMGGFIRRPESGGIVSNLAVGGKAFNYELSNRDRLICDKLGKELKSKGLFFVGVDIIGGYLTEINVTSPTGLSVLGGFHNIDYFSIFWKKIIDKC